MGTVENTLPQMIEIGKSSLMKSAVPGHVWRCAPFKWRPQTFGIESDQINTNVKFIEPSAQNKSLLAFLTDPLSPCIYGVAGNSDDVQAKYFAAFLVQAHQKARARSGKSSNVWWIPLYGNFSNPWLEDDRDPPSMIVITNLAQNSSSTKLEKARDILEKYSDVPRVVVNVGCDPMSFLVSRLYVQVNAVTYFSAGLLKSKIEII